MNESQIAKVFGCTPAQLATQRASNAASLTKLAGKARATGKKVRGYTAAQLALLADKSAKLASPSSFRLVSNEFGYPIYAAHVDGRTDVEITDLEHEAATFDGLLNDANAMAQAISKAFGYAFKAVKA